MGWREPQQEGLILPGEDHIRDSEEAIRSAVVSTACLWERAFVMWKRKKRIPGGVDVHAKARGSWPLGGNVWMTP